MDQLD